MKSAADAPGRNASLPYPSPNLFMYQAAFPVAGQWYTLTAITAHRSFETRILCRYVRREMRQLDDDDRSRYLDALEKIHRRSMAEGLELYGEQFVNYEKMTGMHMDQVGGGSGVGSRAGSYRGLDIVTNGDGGFGWIPATLFFMESQAAAPSNRTTNPIIITIITIITNLIA